MSAMLDYMQLCRLCLVKEKVNVPIFGDENDVEQIFLKITACLPVKVTQEDNLPKKICDSCLYKVDLLYQFWNTTVNAEKQLIQWLTEIGVDVNIKNSDTQTLPILPQSHAHPHSMPLPIPVVVADLKQERPDIVEKQPGFQMPEQPNLYSGFDNLGYPQAEVTMEVGAANTFVQPEPVEEPPPPDPPAPTPKKRGRPAGTTNKKSPPKKKPTPAPPVVVSSRTNSTRRSSATAAAAAVAAAAAAATDSEEDSDGDRLGGMDYDDSDSDEDHITKEEFDSDEDYVKPKSFIGVPSSADGEQPGPSGLGGVKGEAAGANATESGSEKKKNSKGYSCSKCFKVFKIKTKLRIHKISHTEIHQFKCNYCAKFFKYETTLQQHIKWVHRSNIACSICDRCFESKANLTTHLEIYANSTPITCTDCPKQFHTKGEAALHQYKNHTEMIYKCFYCEEPMETWLKLKEHILMQHKEHEDGGHDCEFCGKPCNNQYYTNKHIYRVHLKMYEKICDICGKQCSTGQVLKEHLLLHAGIRPLQCQYCDKTFTKQSNLKVHLRIHTGEKPYPCTKCEKSFNQRSSFVLHMRKHDNIRPYVCELCTKSFVCKSELNTHKKSKHKLIVENKSDDLVFS